MEAILKGSLFWSSASIVYEEGTKPSAKRDCADGGVP